MKAGCSVAESMDLGAQRERQRRVLAAVLAVNAASFAMMVAAARWSRSSALLSNSLDNLGDALTYALSLYAVGMGPRAKARVALIKGLMISGSALAVALQIVYRSIVPAVPLFEVMGTFAVLNMMANGVCLWLLWRHRGDDVNMASVWECSRNDVGEGAAVLAAAAGVAWIGSGWPDLVVATALLLMFLVSARRVLRSAWRELRA